MTSNLVSTGALLLFIPKPRDEQWIANIRTRYPGLDVRWECTVDPVTGQDRKSADLDPAVLQGLTLLCAASMDIPTAEQIKDVKFVQLVSAGVDRWLQHEKYRDPDVMFCTANGAHAPQIAEWVMGSWLMAQHAFLHYAENMKRGHWEPWAGSKQLGKLRDSRGLRMGVLGYGAIGRQCARLATSMGIEVYAYTRSPKPTPEARKDDSYCVPGTGDSEGLLPKKWFHGASREDVNAFLSQGLDLLVISLPLTPSTMGLISREQFNLMSNRGTYVVNIARGQVIDTDALTEALEEEKIRGAALDVTDPEPLPEGHPLWKAKNLFITPHVSWASPVIFDRCLAVLEQNLERLAKEERPINLVDKIFNY